MSKITDWIRMQRSKGYTYTQIEQHLVSNGYPKSEIDAMILEIETGNQKEASKDSPNIIMWIIVILFISGACAGGYFLFLYKDQGTEKMLPINRADSSPSDDLSVDLSMNDSSDALKASRNISVNASNINLSDLSDDSGSGNNISANSSGMTFNTTPNSSHITLICGDNKVNGTEECDGSNLKGLTCRNFTNALGEKFNGGSLKCDRCVINLSRCTYCGDGIVNTDSGEYCEHGVGFVVFTKNGNRYDWLVSPNNPCKNFGYSSGTVSCNFDTCQWDISGCTNRVSAVCGNGKLEASEECDYGIIGRQNESSCAQFNVTYRQRYTGGELECTSDCEHDFSECTYPDD